MEAEGTPFGASAEAGDWADGFEDRRHGGRVLASHLRRLRGHPDAIVLGLPRGGVVVAAEVASELGLPLDVCVVRKLGVPGHEELAFGAIASGGVEVRNPDVMAYLEGEEPRLQAVVEHERAELSRRERAYRGGRPEPELAGRTVILVDDGLATGATMRAAVSALRQRGPARVVVAVPVGSVEACAELDALADEVVCVAMPRDFGGGGAWYHDFRQTTDDEVRELLAQEGRAPRRL